MPPPACPVELLQLREERRPEAGERTRLKGLWAARARQIQAMRSAGAPQSLINQIVLEMVKDERYWPDPDTLGGRMLLAGTGEGPVRLVDGLGGPDTLFPYGKDIGGAPLGPPLEPLRLVVPEPERKDRCRGQSAGERWAAAEAEVGSWLVGRGRDELAYLLQLPTAYEIRCRERLQRVGWVAGPLGFWLFLWGYLGLLHRAHGLETTALVLGAILFCQQVWSKGVRRLIDYMAETARLKERREQARRDGRVPALFQEEKEWRKPT